MASFAPTLEDLLSRNSKYAETSTPAHSIAQVQQGVIPFPGVIIVSCVDARIVPEEYGLFGREQFNVVRNAGGRAEPALRDIVALSTLGPVTDVVVVHHIDCGMTHITNAGVRQSLRDLDMGDEKLDTFDFGEITDLEQSVRDDVAFLKSSPYVKKEIKIHGYVMDLLNTGKLRPV